MSLFSRRSYLFAAVALIGAKLWLVAAQPVVAVGGAIHDDRLFLLLAQSILQGEWLGDYSHFTLMKGPMYSLWIAATVVLHVPLPLANQLLYLAGCWLVVRALRPHLGPDAIALGIFALLWWNPMSYEAHVLGRILRQHLYTPAALLLFAGLIALETRRQAAWPRRLGWGLLAGGSFGVLWLTREESVWVVPSVALLVAAAAVNARRGGTGVRSWLAPVGAGTVAALVVIGGVAALNWRHYGWFGTNEFRSDAFVAAYGALQRVETEQPLPGVMVTRAVREQCYAVSPAFAELRPHFEGDMGLAWAQVTAAFTGRDPQEREIAGGWFMWALREAVDRAGYHRNAADTLAYYQRLADEIHAACAAGTLRCGPRRDTLMPAWKPGDLGRLAAVLPQFLDYFATFRGFTARAPASMGDAHLLTLFSDLTRWRLAPSPDAPTATTPPPAAAEWRVTILHRGGKLLRGICTVVVYGGAGVWVILAVAGVVRRRWTYRFVAATALLGASFAVVLINALVHVLSFPNLSPGAFAQAYPLALLFGALVWYDAWVWITTRQAAPGVAAPGRSRE